MDFLTRKQRIQDKKRQTQDQQEEYRLQEEALRGPEKYNTRTEARNALELEGMRRQGRRLDSQMAVDRAKIKAQKREEEKRRRQEEESRESLRQRGMRRRGVRYFPSDEEGYYTDV